MAVTVEDVIKEVKRLSPAGYNVPVQDILAYMNTAMIESASATLPDGSEMWLPVLETTGEVTTTQDTLDFTSGSVEPTGTITGDTSGATATVTSVSLTTGSYAGGNAIGIISHTGQSGTFQAETLSIAGNSNIATISGDSTVSNPFAAMPTDYMKGYAGSDIFFCHSNSRDINLEILGSYAYLNQLYPGLDQTGSVCAVTVRGDRLYFNPMGSDTLTLGYFKKPTELTFGDTITEMPDRFIVKALSRFALERIFEEFEIDKQIQPGYSITFGTQFLIELKKLFNFTGPFAPLSDEIQDVYKWEY